MRGKAGGINIFELKGYAVDVNGASVVDVYKFNSEWYCDFFIFKCEAFAYSAVFKSSFKLKGITTNNYRTKPQILYKSMDELNEGNDSELDTLIERIVHGGEFYW